MHLTTSDGTYRFTLSVKPDEPGIDVETYDQQNGGYVLRNHLTPDNLRAAIDTANILPEYKGPSPVRSCIWTVERGPYYRCQEEGGPEILHIHQDLSTRGWRVYYVASGVSNLHSGEGPARREARDYLSQHRIMTTYLN